MFLHWFWWCSSLFLSRFSACRYPHIYLNTFSLLTITFAILNKLRRLESTERRRESLPPAEISFQNCTVGKSFFLESTFFLWRSLHKYCIMVTLLSFLPIAKKEYFLDPHCDNSVMFLVEKSIKYADCPKTESTSSC